MSKTGFRKIRSSALLPLFSAALIAGCSEDPAQQAEQAEDSPRMVEREAPRRAADPATEASKDQDSADFKVVPQIDAKLEQDGMGLETMINASSKKAFAESMSWIAEDVSKKQYERLERSLRYIEAYDSSVLGSEERYLELIDGKTGQELIDRANRLLQDRRGG